MSSFQSLLKVLKTIDALPESMYNSVVPHFDNECEACLDAIKTGLTKCLCEETAFDLEDYTKEQAQEFSVVWLVVQLTKPICESVW